MPLQYTSLDPTRSEIRTLTLLPGVFDDEIRCTIAIVSLDENPHYDALSYAWGSDRDSKNLLVNGQVCTITANLDAALRRLRLEDDSRIIWVDALCINQDDIPEKNHQVPLMGKVYSRASRVIAWLGESTASIDALALYMEEHEDATQRQHSEASLLFRPSSSVENGPTATNLFQGLFEVFQTSYFARMWTFQEYSLATKEPIAMCGKHRLSLYQLKNILDVATDDQGYGIARSLETKSLGEWREGYMAALVNSPRSNLVNVLMLFEQGEWKPKYGHMVDTLFIMTMSRICSDPRDRIYALYGMSDDFATAPPPDYTKPMSQVVMETVIWLHGQKQGNFPVALKFGGLRDDRLQNRDVPSWLPEFSASDPVSTSVQQNYIDSGLTGRLLDDVGPTTIDGHKFLCRGRSLGVIEIRHEFPPLSKSMDVYVNDLLNILTNGEVFPQWSKRDLAIAFDATSVEPWIVGPGPARVTSEHKTIVRYLKQALQSNVAVHHLLPNLYGKVLFSARDGNFGIATGMARDGDVLALIPDFSWSPVLLRCGSDCEQAELRMPCRCPQRLVGVAYVDGIMGNRAVDFEVVNKIWEEVEVEDFVII